jgi:hypothetical protein
MEEIDKYYKVLKVSPNDSFHKIRMSYNTLMLKFHPSKPLGRFHKEYFKQIVLAYDLLSKLHKYSNDITRSDKEIYEEWIELDMAFALEKVDQYSKMRFKDYEKEFLPGCFKVFKAFAYLLFFIVAIASIDYPIEAYKDGQIPGLYLFIISVGYTIPLFVVVYRTIAEENFVTRRIWDKFKLDLYLFHLRLKKKSLSSSNDLDKDMTKLNSEISTLSK